MTMNITIENIDYQDIGKANLEFSLSGCENEPIGRTPLLTPIVNNKRVHEG
jgi:hypothetical protein